MTARRARLALLVTSAATAAFGCEAVLGIGDRSLPTGAVELSTDTLTLTATGCTSSGDVESAGAIDIVNHSAAPAAWSASLHGADSSPFVLLTASGVVPGNGTSPVVVARKPTRIDGSVSDDLTVTVAGVAYPATVRAQLPSLSPSDTVHDFGTVRVGRSESWPLTITNPATFALTVNAQTSGDDAEIHVDPPTASIPPGGQTTFTVSYAATGAATGPHADGTRLGGHASRLVVTPSGSCVPPVTVTLTGRSFDAARHMAAGAFHTCVVGESGAVYCWGQNRHGELGNGATTDSPYPVRVAFDATSALPDPTTSVQPMGLGSGFSCTVLASSSVACWGRGDVGQMGNGATADSLLPVTALGLHDARSLSASGGHVCVTTVANGAVRCWGTNTFGEIATTPICSTCASTQPTYPGVTGLSATGASAVGAGEFFTCALAAPTGGSGTVWCWGTNVNGAYGDGTTGAGGATPNASHVTDAVALAVGWYHVCALRADGSVWCWGGNAYGEVGTPDLGSAVTEPFHVPLPDAAIAISSGANHSCALLRSQELRCWGTNASGQLGVSVDTLASSAPVRPGQDTDGGAPLRFVAIACGGYHTCGIAPEGTVRCWGNNNESEIGNGVTLGRVSTPTEVIGF